MENDILSEVKKPLTKRGWERSDEKVYPICYRRIFPDGHRGTWMQKGGAVRKQLELDQPALIARIEALEAERRWIPVEEWMSNSENEMVNVTTWHSDFAEEFPVAYFIDGAWVEWNNGGMPGDNLPKPEFVRPLPSPPDRAQERGSE